MSRELTKREISYLFSYVEKKGVKYLDLQYELVDHLASAVEDTMEGMPSMSFENALEFVVLKEFRNNGFKKIVKEKRRSIRSFWKKRTYETLLSYCSFKTILVGLIIFLTVLTMYAKVDYTFLVLLAVCTFLSVAVWFRFYYSIGYNYKQHNNLLFIEEFEKTKSYSRSLMSLFIFINIFEANFPILGTIVGALCVTLFVLWELFVLFGLPKMLEKEMNKRYAHIDFNNFLISK